MKNSKPNPFKFIFCLLILLVTIRVGTFAQSKEYQKINFIITIDGEFTTTNGRLLDSSSFVINDKEKIKIGGYLPGEMLLLKNDFEKLKESDIGSLELFLVYSDTKKDEIYEYSIPINPLFLSKSYVILKIYNHHKKENRRKFFPHNNEKYSFDILSSDLVYFAKRK